MLDIAFIRQNVDAVRAAITNKRCDVDLDALLAADKERRDAIASAEGMLVEGRYADAEAALSTLMAKDPEDKHWLLELARDAASQAKPKA